MKTIKNPFFVDLGGTEKEGSDISKRLDRYALAHKRALYMSNYIEEIKLCQNAAVSPLYDKYLTLFTNIKKCGHWLVFRDYYTVQEKRLISADFCKKHLLCPLCAIRRGSKYLKAYLEKYETVLKENSNLKPYFVTLTVKNGPDLEERFNHLKKGLKRMTEDRRRFLNGSERARPNEFSKAEGGVYSIEFKRGKTSGEWHPHVHMLWLCEDIPSQNELSEEWRHYTKDSFIVDVRPLYGDLVAAFCEVFKYALKFTNLSLEDNFEAFEKLSGRRLVNPFGCLRGVEIPEHLEDDFLSEDLPYIDYFYQYTSGFYDLKKHSQSA